MVKIYLLYCNDKLVSIHRTKLGAQTNLTYQDKYKLFEKDVFSIKTDWLED